MENLARIDYSIQTEMAVNKLINFFEAKERILLNMAYLCKRDNVALQGFSELLLRLHHKARTNKLILCNLQVEKGGKVVLKEQQSVASELDNQQYVSAVAVAEQLLGLAKESCHQITEFHSGIVNEGGNLFQKSLIYNLLDDNRREVYHSAQLVTKFKMAGEGLGAYQVDKDIFSFQF